MKHPRAANTDLQFCCVPDSQLTLIFCFDLLLQLDIAQLFSKPVVLIQEVENVTAMLTAIAR